MSLALYIVFDHQIATVIQLSHDEKKNSRFLQLKDHKINQGKYIKNGYGYFNPKTVKCSS